MTYGDGESVVLGDCVRVVADHHWSTVTGVVVGLDEGKVRVQCDANTCYVDGKPVYEKYRTTYARWAPSALKRMDPPNVCAECSAYIARDEIDYLCDECRARTYSSAR